MDTIIIIILIICCCCCCIILGGGGYYYIKKQNEIKPTNNTSAPKSNNTSVPTSENIMSEQTSDNITSIQTTTPIPILYPFTSHTFTNADETGRTGPTLSAVRNAYSSASWASSYLNMTNDDGIQLWTVPKTGTYKIRAVGAGVPYNDNYKTNGMNEFQKGMDVTINATLMKDEVIRILIGQMPSTSNTVPMGGAGGTFVVRETQTPILVAGGGGSRGQNKADILSNATNNNAGQTSVGTSGIGNNVRMDNGGKGGSDGSGGFIGGNAFAGAGGGLTGNGDNSTAGGGGLSFTNGGIGGNSKFSVGGFGGGGGGGSQSAGGGGGGGYSGGGGGTNDGVWTSGGGGGSYSITDSFISSSANNNGNGSVTITFINSTITPLPAIQILYPFTSHTFTNANATGQYGPKLTDVRTAYSSASWAASYLNMINDNGIQLWTVPATGNYSIQAIGAASGNPGQNGLGRDIRLTTALKKGEVIKILVGQQGIKGPNLNAGGGGGTFVVRDINTAILVAGGGGGRSQGAPSDLINSNAGDTKNGNKGGDGSGSKNGNGGTDGNGGDGGYSHSGGGGGGLLTNGGNSEGLLSFGGVSFINGGIGGIEKINNVAYGGFGGGGGSTGGGGGGGGYSGGGGGFEPQWASGGGGGSYGITAFKDNGYNNGQGKVIIKLMN